MTTLSHLECSLCGRAYRPAEAPGVCQCGGALLARYDLALARRSWSRDWIRNAPANMWRYAPVLPVRKPGSLVSLGEGMTPLLRLARLGERLGITQLWLKDEGLNPTGSVKARGMACAVSMAVELGSARLAVASAGNAGVALAAYAAAAGLDAQVFVPRMAARRLVAECRLYGARVTLVEGDAGACEELLDRQAQTRGWQNLTAWREPYRMEGAKTLGYELAEQFNWETPDVLVCPAGHGLGLIAIWKALEEMETLGWIARHRTRLIAVQTEGCCPLVETLQQHGECAQSCRSATAIAPELAIGKPAGHLPALRALAASGGVAIAVSDEELLAAGLDMARLEGVLPSLEGAAAAAAIPKLLASGALHQDQRVVLVNTGSGQKGLHVWARRLATEACAETDKLGGLITPR